MSKFKKIFIPLLLILIFFTGCTKKTIEPISKTEFIMGTVCTIKIYDEDNKNDMEKAFSKIKDIEDKMTINKEGSEIQAVNKAAGIEPVKVSSDTFYVVKTGIEYSKLSSGRFDITIGPLVKLWGIGTDNARVPSLEEINKSKALINYNDIVLNEENKSIYLKNKDMVLDLGGIAKGYTADQVVKVLKENGVEHAIVNLGGNIFAMDKNIDASKWKIGVQNPFSTRGESIGAIQVENKSVVTSGIYERYFENEGKHYHHILNPSTGYPYDNSLAGVTIISDTSIAGDTLSTSVFALGLTEGLKFMENYQGADAIFITKDKEVYLTSGIKDDFILRDSNFTIKN